MKNILYCFPVIMLTACHSNDKVNQPIADTSVHQVSSVSTVANTSTESATLSSSALSATVPQLTAEGKIQIDWKKIDTNEPVVDKHKFAYKFTPDSIPVQNYIKAYNVDNLTAQYNLTIGMGANEPLDKLLDQIGTSYVSHELTAGKDSKLVIHTTPKVIATEHDYVLTDPFAKGLILPIKIIPDGKK